MRNRLAVSLASALFLWAASCMPAAAESGGASLGPFEVLGGGTHYLDVGAGYFNVRNHFDKRSPAGRIELRIGKKIAFVGPAAGLVANDDGARYGYTGIYADFAYGNFVLTPLLAIGAYHRGNSVDLGGPFEFRESLELAYRLGGRFRAGISLAHISNANLYRVNPGQQDLLLTLAIGF